MQYSVGVWIKCSVLLSSLLSEMQPALALVALVHWCIGAVVLWCCGAVVAVVQCIVAKKRDPGILDPELFLAQIRKVEARLGKLAKIRKVETD